MGVRGFVQCAQVCTGVLWYVRVSFGVRSCVWVFRCMLVSMGVCRMNFQNTYWRLVLTSANFNIYPIGIFNFTWVFANTLHNAGPGLGAINYNSNCKNIWSMYVVVVHDNKITRLNIFNILVYCAKLKYEFLKILHILIINLYYAIAIKK